MSCPLWTVLCIYLEPLSTLKRLVILLPIILTTNITFCCLLMCISDVHGTVQHSLCKHQRKVVRTITNGTQHYGVIFDLTCAENVQSALLPL